MKGWHIEKMMNGKWCWLVLPPFRTIIEARAEVERREAAEPGSMFRVVPQTAVPGMRR